MENKDIIALSTVELQSKMKEEKANFIKLKLNHAISPIENPIKIRDNRKVIARLSTELTKRNKATK
ncbi:MAG: 50S ribosomal protein L29 [Bacteroidia bacterium]|jgi:large subunit ribosomal protein L29|nr:50S ribosomal protein L29 [Bacteroidia bacterium]